jgi:hypothetical protein
MVTDLPFCFISHNGNTSAGSSSSFSFTSNLITGLYPDIPPGIPNQVQAVKLMMSTSFSKNENLVVVWKKVPKMISQQITSTIIEITMG